MKNVRLKVRLPNPIVRPASCGDGSLYVIEYERILEVKYFAGDWQALLENVKDYYLTRDGRKQIWHEHIPQLWIPITPAGGKVEVKKK